MCWQEHSLLNGAPTLSFVRVGVSVISYFGLMNTHSLSQKKKHTYPRSTSEVRFRFLTVVLVTEVMTCWMAQGVTRMMKVREMAAQDREARSLRRRSTMNWAGSGEQIEVRSNLGVQFLASL